jgi:carbon storage regulator CsrA
VAAGDYEGRAQVTIGHAKPQVGGQIRESAAATIDPADRPGSSILSNGTIADTSPNLRRPGAAADRHEGALVLVLTRRANQRIMIGRDVVITVLEVRGDQVRLGIRAPRSVEVHREEVFLERERTVPEPPRAAQAHQA